MEERVFVLERREDVSKVRMLNGSVVWVNNSELSNNESGGVIMSGKTEKQERKEAQEEMRQRMLDNAIALQKAKEEMESKKVRTQTYYFTDTKGQRYPVTKEVYEMLKEHISTTKEVSLIATEFKFADTTKDESEWATVTFPLDSVWYVLTAFEMILPLEEVKKIESLGGTTEEM